MLRRAMVLLLVGMTLAGTQLLSACGSKSPATQSAAPISFWAAPTSAVPIVVAQREGYFSEVGLNIDPRPSIDNKSPFLAGKSPFVVSSPWEVAQERMRGEDIMVAGTGGQTRFINGIVIRKADAEKYKHAKDLIGKKLGNPGFDSGVWIALEGVAKSEWGIDARNAFQNVTAGPGALLGLLEKGEIEASLLYSGQTIAGLASGNFVMLFGFDTFWQQKTGYPLCVGTLVARGPWLRQNVDTVRKINSAMDKAATWMSQHPDEFNIGGRYESYSRDAGWLANTDTIKEVMKMIVEWRMFTKAEMYTDDWVKAHQEFNNILFGDKSPPAKDIFWPPADLKAK